MLSLVTTPLTEAHLLGLYQRSQVDGVILMDTASHDWRVDLLREHNLPFVTIGRCENTIGIDFVDVDLETGIQESVRYLSQTLDHHHIGFLSNTKLDGTPYSFAAHRSHLAFEKTLKECGIEGLAKPTVLSVEGPMRQPVNSSI